MSDRVDVALTDTEALVEAAERCERASACLWAAGNRAEGLRVVGDWLRSWATVDERVDVVDIAAVAVARALLDESGA